MNQIWLFRMVRWAKHPPSGRRVRLVLAVVALCLLIAGAERLFGFPDWLAVNRLGR